MLLRSSAEHLRGFGIRMIKLDFTKMGGLVTAVTVDDTSGDVLMVAFMNEQAFQRTVETGIVHYFSRSRNKLWKKGESSGHVQKVKEIRVDCDLDALVIRAEQTGPACHEGYRSCFFRSLRDGETLEPNQERMLDPNQVYGAKS
jgi:phosphoribosyl-AMP cyclohydrolase